MVLQFKNYPQGSIIGSSTYYFRHFGGINSTCTSVSTSGSATVTDLDKLTVPTINSIAKKIAQSSAISRTTTEVYATLATGDVVLLSANGTSASQVTIAMNGTNYAYDIIGFNHDTDAGGNVGITFQMHDCFGTKYPIKSSMTSTDGWGNSDMRSTTMPLLIGYLPAAWQNILVSVNKTTANNVSDATLVVSSDKMWLPSEYEIFGSTSYSKAQEGNQYAYYANGGSKIKKVNGSAYYWWERSPYYWNSNYSCSIFCCVNNNGNATYGDACYSYGVSPCFAIGSTAYTATTSIPSGTQQSSGIGGFDAAEIKKCANAIAANAGISNETSVCYIIVNDNQDYYTISVGDQISWTMNGTSYPYRIMGFNHYDKADGTGKAGILFQMVDCFTTKYAMKSSMTSADGWDDSDLRTTMNGTLLGYLPSAVQSAISSVTISTAQDVSTSTIITTSDKLFLPAEVEVFGTTTYAKGGTSEGTWYAWYRANNTAASRIKNVNGSAYGWWERSPYYWNGSYSIFCSVNKYGNANNSFACDSYGVSPCFCF